MTENQFCDFCAFLWPIFKVSKGVEWSQINPKNIGWWRRGESNPRPHKSHSSFYARVPSLNLILPTADGQAIGRTSGHEMVSPRRAATPRQD